MKRRNVLIILSLIAVVAVIFLIGNNWKTSETTNEEKQDENIANEVTEKMNSLESAVAKEDWDQAAQLSSDIAIYYEENEQFEEAISYFEQAADHYEKAGRLSFVDANNIRAQQISTEMDVYVEQPLPENQELEKFEPTSGTYLGFYLAGKRENASPDPMEEIYGRNHALYLTYSHWRNKYEDTDSYFPITFAENAKRNGSGIQVAWEPSDGLDDVLDDEYVRQFAREAKATGIPIFIRFAGEMNGEWVPWHDEPEKYIEKFRLIHDIMEEEAPNVAMVWSPNFLPRYNIDEFYPGDEYVDWVGLSLYTIPFSHGREVPGGNPIDYLKPIYETYSHKPIMISEGAVSHVSYEQEKDYSEWAASQIGNMYGFMPKMYPQVKAITYFNLDKLTTNYDNQNNNYDLADSKLTDEAYQKMIQHRYFIDHLNLSEKYDQIKSQYVPLKEATDKSETKQGFIYVKLPLGVQPDRVALYQGDSMIVEADQQPWEIEFPFDKIDKNKPLTVIAYDEQDNELASKKVELE